MADPRTSSPPTSSPDTGNKDVVEDRDSPGRPTAAVIAVIVGVMAVVAGFIPGFFWAAWLLGVIAIVASLPALRQGPAAPSHTLARVAAGAGALALIVGLLNLGITLEWFDYFNPD